MLLKKRLDFKPRKDQCDVCVSFKEGNCSEEKYNLCITKKDESYS
jgi:hypothetical protein